MEEGKDYYYSEEGLIVFTEVWHKKRGFCCANGCLHCPFDYENMSVPAREKLLKNKEKQ